MAKTLIVSGTGINCEAESAAGFEMCGAETTTLHLNDILETPRVLAQYHILVFPGGFSYGDHLGAGTVIANRLRYHLGSELNEFISNGKLIIGICNGFQTMTRLGLLPAIDGAFFKQQATLAQNSQGVFRNAWVTLRVNQDSPCIFTKGIDTIALPIRHGEGQFVAESPQLLAQLEKENLVALRYIDPETGEKTDVFPHNPNGSVNAIAGICDYTGRIFGLMPHPEAYLSPYNHPHWQRQKLNGVLPEKGVGAAILQNAVDFAEANLA